MKFGFTAVKGAKVDAPMIEECYANFECRLYEGSQVSKHGLFIWEVVKAACRDISEVPRDSSLPARGKIHDLGKRD